VLDAEHKRFLLIVAMDSIRHGLKHGRALPVELGDTPPALAEPGASFVTLSIDGELRGCIGTLEAKDPLIRDVVKNAYCAAFSDPRFPPVDESECSVIAIKISILTPPEAFPVANESELLEKLRPGIDGLILEDGQRRATFLPAVWEDVADPKEFVEHLKRKAGIPANSWSPRIRAFRYRTESFAAEDLE
jgi:hypothetical protein